MVSGVDQGDADPVFSATADLAGKRVTVVVSGEVDMSTADAMYDTATRDRAAVLDLDLRAVTFFDSAAIHALIRLAERYPDALTVHPSRQVRRILDISGLGGQPWLAAD
jgi:stage II sporulation protein AA (anti-sigma F factor antagonist)